ncbi:MAG: hypothetical protein COA86_11405 [Kangiella sp.]|nr:MAG: hypothetical protein COA86_11405 [Kangiella sp.]
MEIKLLEEVLDCLNDGRRLVHYYDDQYALYLLQKFCEKKITKDQSSIQIKEIKSSCFAKLLNKPSIVKLLSELGDGKLSSDRLLQVSAQEFESYVITLSQWGKKEDYPWEQTSVPGSNLVLQLNLTNKHDQLLKDLEIDSEPFRFDDHPIHSVKNSLSWARIDFNFETGEALIEEVQNDWLRIASRHAESAKRAILNGSTFYRRWGVKYKAKNMLEYTQDLLPKHKKNWQEITLFYAIKLIKQEIGINKIFYHSYETGALLKNINGRLPPRSLYTDLPKRFCFTPCNTGPEFITKDCRVKRKLKKAKTENWFCLSL